MSLLLPGLCARAAPCTVREEKFGRAHIAVGCLGTPNRFLNAGGHGTKDHATRGLQRAGNQSDGLQNHRRDPLPFRGKPGWHRLHKAMPSPFGAESQAGTASMSGVMPS